MQISCIKNTTGALPEEERRVNMTNQGWQNKIIVVPNRIKQSINQCFIQNSCLVPTGHTKSTMENSTIYPILTTCTHSFCIFVTIIKIDIHKKGKQDFLEFADHSLKFDYLQLQLSYWLVNTCTLFVKIPFL